MSELLLYHNEELGQIFRKRFNDFDETYEGAGADTEKILKSQMMVRYILINTESFNIIAKVIDDHIKEFGNDAHRLATYLSLITDIIIKGCKTTNSPEMFKENLQNIALVIADTKKHSLIEKVNACLVSLSKRQIYPKESKIPVRRICSN